MASTPKKPLPQGKAPPFGKGEGKVKPKQPPRTAAPKGGSENRDAARRLMQGGKFDSYDS